MKKLNYLAPILIAMACLGLQQAKADFSFDLTTGNPAISGFPGPYAMVNIHLTDAMHADITFTAYSGYLLGGNGSMNVNVNAGAWTVSNLFNNGTGAVTDGGSKNADGFGNFNQTFDTHDGFSDAGTVESFTLTRSSGMWASANVVLILNDTTHNALAAGHIFAGGANGSTGYAAGSGDVHINPLSTPDGGATVMLLGTALGALGMARRYLKR